MTRPSKNSRFCWQFHRLEQSASSRLLLLWWSSWCVAGHFFTTSSPRDKGIDDLSHVYDPVIQEEIYTKETLCFVGYGNDLHPTYGGIKQLKVSSSLCFACTCSSKYFHHFVCYDSKIVLSLLYMRILFNTHDLALNAGPCTIFIPIVAHIKCQNHHNEV